MIKFKLNLKTIPRYLDILRSQANTQKIRASIAQLWEWVLKFHLKFWTLDVETMLVVVSWDFLTLRLDGDIMLPTTLPPGVWGAKELNWVAPSTQVEASVNKGVDIAYINLPFKSNSHDFYRAGIKIGALGRWHVCFTCQSSGWIYGQVSRPVFGEKLKNSHFGPQNLDFLTFKWFRHVKPKVEE